MAEFLDELIQLSIMSYGALSIGPHSRFTAEYVASLSDLTSRVAIVTGGGGDLGLEISHVLASRGATVVIACRTLEETETAVAKFVPLIRQRLHIMYMDMMDLESVRNFARAFRSRFQMLHILINNAGVMACPLMRTVQGHEAQMGTNYISHFLLTMLLLDVLKASAPARVICVSSAAHRIGRLDFDDLDWRNRTYRPWFAYGQSKLACCLFAAEFSRRYAADGVIAVSVHPGVIYTKLVRHAPFYLRCGLKFVWPVLKSVAQGAATPVYCAVTDSLQPGAYYEDCMPAVSSDAATNSHDAERLWAWTTSAVYAFMDR